MRKEREQDWRDLELPKMDVLSLLRGFGPGMILMMTGIGTSHLVTAPTAGGRFAFALLWCIPIAYVFKYYGFEMAFRFTNATGKSLMEAYSTAWGKWPLWYVLVTTVVQSAIGQAEDWWRPRLFCITCSRSRSGLRSPWRCWALCWDCLRLW